MPYLSEGQADPADGQCWKVHGRHFGSYTLLASCLVPVQVQLTPVCELCLGLFLCHDTNDSCLQAGLSGSGMQSATCQTRHYGHALVQIAQ